MLPPIEDSILHNNPDFGALYTTLTTVVLNADGSTKSDPAAKDRKAVREQLNRHRLKSAKQHLLAHAIATADPIPTDTAKPSLPQPTIGNRRAKPQSQLRHNRSNPPAEQLPPALLDLLLLLPSFLSTTPECEPSPSTTALLLSNPPFSLFPTLTPHLSALISTNLHASAVHLARISNPSTNPSFVHRSVPALPGYATTLITAVQSLQASLASSRLTTAVSITALLSQNAVALSHLLRSLESKHGPIARSLEFRASEMALNAQRQQQEVQITLWQARRDVYSDEATQALGNYMMHLRDGRARLREGVKNLTTELAGYGVDLDGDDGLTRRGGDKGREREKGKERTMREMARAYREMGRQVEEVRGDLERLGRA